MSEPDYKEDLFFMPKLKWKDVLEKTKNTAFKEVDITSGGKEHKALCSEIDLTDIKLLFDDCGDMFISTPNNDSFVIKQGISYEDIVTLCEIMSKNKIDKEIYRLVKYMNMIEGMHTVESCFGHYKSNCRIWFKVDNAEVLNKFIFNCLNADKYWSVKLDNSDPHRDWKGDLHLCLESANCKKGEIDEHLKSLTRRVFEYACPDKALCDALGGYFKVLGMYFE